MFKFHISFKTLKEFGHKAMTKFLKDLKGNLKFEHMNKMLSMNKKSQKLCFFIKLFFQYYLFSVLLRKKRAESSESQPDEPELFFVNLIDWAAQLFAADHNVM